MYWDALKWVYESEETASLKSGPRAILAALAYSMNMKTQQCNPSYARLTRLTSLKEGAVKSALRILMKEKLTQIK